MDLGTRCFAHSLNSIQYNGCQGIVAGHLNNGRIRVRLDIGAIIDVLPQKLSPLLPNQDRGRVDADASAGDRRRVNAGANAGDNANISDSPGVAPCPSLPTGDSSGSVDLSTSGTTVPNDNGRISSGNEGNAVDSKERTTKSGDTDAIPSVSSSNASVARVGEGEQPESRSFQEIFEQFVHQQQLAIEANFKPSVPTVAEVLPDYMLQQPPDQRQRRGYRKFLKGHNRRFSCGRRGYWPDDLLAHFNWWQAGRLEPEPLVDWSRIAPYNIAGRPSVSPARVIPPIVATSAQGTSTTVTTTKVSEIKPRKRVRFSKKLREEFSDEDSKMWARADESEPDSDAPLSSISLTPSAPATSSSKGPAKTKPSKAAAANLPSMPPVQGRKRGRPRKNSVTDDDDDANLALPSEFSPNKHMSSNVPSPPKKKRENPELKSTRQKSTVKANSAPCPDLNVEPPLPKDRPPSPPWGLLLLSCHTCSLSYHMRCLKMKHFPPDSAWNCPECRRAVELDESLGLCLQCGFGGPLVTCDHCPRTFHAQCVKVGKSPSSFKCPTCESAMPAQDKPVSQLMDTVMQLCATAPRSHFLSVFATKLASIRRMEEALGATGEDSKLSESATNEDAAMRELSRRSDYAEKKRVCKLCGEFGHMHQDSVTQVHQEGLYLSETGLSDKQLEMCRNEVQQQFDHLIHTVNTLQLQDQLRDVGFDLIKTRHTGRYDIQVPAFSTLQFSFLNSEGPWMSLVRQVLGEDCQFKHSGCMLALPGAHIQPEHSDGDHLTESKHLAVHALNVFIPFIDLNSQNGCTEFAPTTHILGNYEKPLERLECHYKAGNWLIFDYRLRHRGLANNSSDPRPLLYLTYAKPSWHDKANFSSSRYPKLPDIPRALSREERNARRREVAGCSKPSLPQKNTRTAQETTQHEPNQKLCMQQPLLQDQPRKGSRSEDESSS